MADFSDTALENVDTGRQLEGLISVVGKRLKISMYRRRKIL